MSSGCCGRERHLAKPLSADASETETYICRPLHICFRKHSRAKIQKIRNRSIFVKLYLRPRPHVSGFKNIRIRVDGA